MGGTHRWLVRRLWRIAAAVTACALGLPALTAATPPRSAPPHAWTLPPLPAMKSVPGHPLPASAGVLARARLAAQLAARERGSASARPLSASWPAPGEATVSVGKIVAQAGTLPVQVTEAAAMKGQPAAGGQLTARIMPHSAAVRAGVRGVLLTLSGAGGGLADGGKVKVRLSYAGFAGEYGGGWASRLRLVELPACALTTPDVPACRFSRPVPAVNDPAGQTLTGTVALPSAAPSPPASAAATPGASTMALVTSDTSAGMVLAAQAAPSSSTGDFTATPLQSSGTWASQQGDFTYQYPITVPPSLGGSAPQVSLSYDAQSIDSETSVANTQGGWIGDGWDYSPGYIERSYQPCSQDGIAGSGDECWAGDNAVLSLGGHSSVLIKDDTTGTWHLQGDDGSSVQLKTGAPNGLWSGQYWVVTTTDGTKYYFGRDHLPGTSSGGAATNSAWGAPVYTPSSGDPCYTSANGQSSYCANMGWRWNLDYVVSPDNHLTVYDYAAETNYYEAGAVQNGGTGTLTAYDRGGYPTSISYGWLLSDATAGSSPASQVVFGSSDRCTASSAATCAADETAGAADWPDVPWDLNCASSGTCTNYSPTFWTTKMLTSITTQVLSSPGGTYNKVDSYALSQSFPPGPMNDPVIFLGAITRTTGESGGTPLVPPVTFSSVEIDNRVPGQAQDSNGNTVGITDGSGNPVTVTPVFRPRIAAISTSTGAQVGVLYDDQAAGVTACSRASGGTMPSSPDANTMPCFPVYWTPPGQGPVLDWFKKSLVSSVAVNDASGLDSSVTGFAAGSPQQVTSYHYSGGAAWHQNESPVVPSGQRTWDQYRGYASIEVTTGGQPGDPVTETVTRYMRGMNLDPVSSGNPATVQVADTVGDSRTDYDWLAGQVLETDTYTASGGSVDKKVVNGPWTYAQTASQAEPGGAPTLTAHMIQQSQSRTLEQLKDGTWRARATTTYYNSDALVTAVDDNPDGSAETCTSTSYSAVPSGNPMMLSYPARVTEVSGAASGGACPAAIAADLVSDTRYYYDQPGAAVSSLGTPGTPASPGGLVTGVAKADKWPQAGEHWAPQSATVYDEYGRVTSSQDGDGNPTGTSYSPGTGVLPTAVTVTNAKTWQTVTGLDQGRQLPLRVTDPNGNVTTEAYDALGRLVSVTLPVDQSSGDPTYKYSYTVTGTSPPAVTTQTLREDGTYAVKVSIYDGMGQLRQVQQTPADNEPGRVITDTAYDSHGWTFTTSTPYYNNGSGPVATPFVATTGDVPSQTVTTYDGQGRVVGSEFQALGQGASPTVLTGQWSTGTAYPGLEETDVSPPSGGTATSAFTNVLGQATASWLYTTATPDGNATDAAVTQYTYWPGGQLHTVTDNSGNVTTYTYDYLGRKTQEVSPDSGTTSWQYDDAGNVTSVTTGRGTVAYAYDALNRKTAEYQGSASGTELASWSYDSAAGGKGQLASSSSYDSSGQAWTEAVTGYTAGYQPTGTVTTVPPDAGAALQSPAGGYTTSDAYTPLTGLPASTSYSGDGGLPAETVSYAYDLSGLPLSSGGLGAYTAGTVYDALGRVQRAVFGMRGGQVARTYAWDQQTGRLLTAVTDVQQLDQNLYNADAAADTVNYTYDPAGLVTSVSDWENGAGAGGAAATQTQCFTYNHLGQLTQAWTDSGGTSTAAAPSVAGAGGCVDAAPSAAVVGGPAPYWESFTGNLLGDRTGEVVHDPSGNTANDVTQQVSYPPAGQGSGLQPADAPSQVTTTSSGGSVATVPVYDGAGDTSGQLNTASGAAPPAGPPGASDVEYTPQGRVSQVTLPGGGVARYVYDAAGNLIFQQDPQAGSVLYLDGGAEQLTLPAGGSAASGVRFYPGPGGTAVSRSSTATAPGAVSFELADPQGTASQVVTDIPDASAPGGYGQAALTRRWFDPYGNPVAPASGTQAVASSWPDNKAFVGRPADGDTGLGLLGARQYDPVTGMFLSPDPVSQPGTLAAGGYTYAGGDPATFADPSGLTRCDVGDCPTAQQTQQVTQRDQGSGGCPSSEPGCPGYGSGGGGGTSGGAGRAGCLVLARGGCVAGQALPQAPGGGAGGLAGVGDSLISTLQMAACAGNPAACLTQQLLAPGLSPLALYRDWIASQGIDTAPDSTYAGGQILGDFLIAAAGGLAGIGETAGAAATAPEAAGAARVPFGPGTEKVWNVLDRVLGKGSPLPGYKGGSVFQNLDGRLPGVDGAGNPITYREWDVNPYVKGVNRGPERLVTGSDGSAFYTGDHYNSFLQFWGPGQ